MDLSRLIGVLLCTILALQAPGSAVADDGDKLKGFWIVSFERRGTSAPSAAAVVGEIALVSNSWLTRANLPTPNRHTISGIYAIDFSRFGFDVRPANRVPLVGGRTFDRDSIDIELNPQFDHGGIMLRGTMISRDSASGVWYEKREAGATGTFVMQRR